MAFLAAQVGVATKADDGFGWVAELNEGFLGTGYSTSVEVTFIVATLIVIYIAYGTAKYLTRGKNFGISVIEILGLRG